MSATRRLKRIQGRQSVPQNTLSKLSDATKQISDLNQILKELPEATRKLEETSTILDAVMADCQVLSDEMDFLWYCLREQTGMTQEQEADLRKKFEEKK